MTITAVNNIEFVHNSFNDRTYVFIKLYTMRSFTVTSFNLIEIVKVNK